MATMKAIRAHSFGGPEVLRLEEVPRPNAEPGMVLVRVHATSVNPIDWKIREGRFREGMKLPFIPGGDFSGVVEEVGAGVTEVKKGDEVYGCVPGSMGADAEYLVAPPWAFAKKPRTLDHIVAASVPLAGMTAWQALFDHGRLKAGERVLILGAAGGVGHLAVQFAKQAKATVLGTGSARSLPALGALGIDRAIDYKQERIEDVARVVDLCCDFVGGDFQSRAFSCVKKGGRLVSAVQPPDEARARSLGIDAMVFRMKQNAAQLREIASRIDAGQLKVEVAKVLPLEKASEAEEDNRQQRVRGKIVLTVAA
jgi:NADPH:quinone reductase-like Zn-dependent oxidoreductase